MNFRDQWAEDTAGNKFLFTVEMQRALSKKGLPVEPSQVSALGEQPSRKVAPPKTEVTKPIEQEVDEPDWGAMEIQIDPASGKYLGRIKWYNHSRGYGFIVRGGGQEVFFHKTAVVAESDSIRDGQWVLYDVEETGRGIEATDVEIFEGDV